MNLRRPLILASRSPRRRQMLEAAGFTFQTVVYDVDESFPEKLPPRKVAEYLSRKKADAYPGEIGGQLIIAADTIVLNSAEEILGKPGSEMEARHMLSGLSDGRHEVITGVTLKSKEKAESFSEKTEVYFKKLLEWEIDYYIENFQPLDKAGAYGIQEWIGLIGVKKISGSYFNVVGLPVQKVYEHLLPYIAVDRSF